MNRDWWDRMLSELPLIAILRGLRPQEADDVAGALAEAGILALEVSLNSPDAAQSVARIRKAHGRKLAIGAGTVLAAQEVPMLIEAGAQFIVSPNTDAAVIHATKHAGMISMPGFATPSEAFVAIAAGADALKLFPAEASSPTALKALKEILPAGMPIFPVGGITADKIKAYREAGAAGFGVGSAIYRAGYDARSVGKNAEKFIEAWRNAKP
jgi:2-dehydro-3-deoxyphosphogalactonate aldolase